MKMRFVLVSILTTVALLSAACATQGATNEPGEVTAMPATSTTDSTATEAATEATGETAMTPTGAAESATPAQGADATGTTPTAVGEGGTPAPEAGATAGIPQTGGLPDDLDEVLRVLRATGATVDLGDAVEHELVSVPGQSVMINGEEVQIFTYTSAEELEAQTSQLADQGDPEEEPQYYKLGNLLVFYDGNDPGVRDLLEDVLGAQSAGQ